MKPQTIWCALCTVLLLLTSSHAEEVGGRTVILVLSQEKLSEGDPMRQKLLTTREQIGFSEKDMPIVFMTFDGSETEREYSRRLGVNAVDGPVLCVVEWAQDAAHGPKRVIGDAVSRRATVAQVEPMLINFLKAANGSSSSQAAQEEIDPLAPGLLSIENHRFEASGKPFYLLDAGVRIRNADQRPLHDIAVRFYTRFAAEDDWRLLEEQRIERLPAGYVASRDYVGNPLHLNLLDENERSRPFHFRIEVEQGGQVLAREGRFDPAALPVAD